jgi:hypothetical protein
LRQARLHEKTERNVPRVIKLPPEKMTSASALLNSLYGEGGAGRGSSFVRRVEKDQQRELTKDAIAVEASYNTPEVWDFAVVNKARVSPYEGKASNLTRIMKLSTIINLYSSGDQMKDLDLATVLRAIKVMVVRVSPVRTGFYRGKHQIRVNGKTVGTPGPGSIKDPSAFGQVYNRVDYSSTLETPDFTKPYQKAFKMAVKRFGKDWDIVLRFANPDTVGGNIKTSRYTAARKKRVYAIPVITVAPVNTLQGAGKFRFVRRRGATTRRNMLSPFAIKRRGGR